MWGVGAFENALNLRDLGTGVKMCYPTTSRLTEDCEMALKMFAGLKLKIQTFYGDSEGGLQAACKKNGIPYRRAQPGNPKTNSLAERANGDILNGARSLLLQAGLPASFWPFAAPY